MTRSKTEGSRFAVSASTELRVGKELINGTDEGDNACKRRAKVFAQELPPKPVTGQHAR